jgi:hypothetical protein
MTEMHDDQEFGFKRTVCACRKCRIWCEHQPGYLVPSDLTRLVPADVDPFVWAEEHLRASRGYVALSSEGIVSIPSLVPAKGESGHCHWYKHGRCVVHDRSPFGCAYLDQHMTNREADQKNEVGRSARKLAFEQAFLYSRIWSHLWEMDLIYFTGDEDKKKALAAIRAVSRCEQSKERRKQRKAKRRARR